MREMGVGRIHCVHVCMYIICIHMYTLYISACREAAAVTPAAAHRGCVVTLCQAVQSSTHVSSIILISNL